MYAKTAKNASLVLNFWRRWIQGRDSGFILLGVLVTLVLAKVLSVVAPITVKELFDSVSSGKSLSTLGLWSYPVVLVAAYGFATFLSVVFSEVKEILAQRFTVPVVASIGQRVYEQVVDRPYEYHVRINPEGEIKQTDRALKSLESLLLMILHTALPVLLEFFIITILFIYKYDVIFIGILAGTFALHVYFTFRITARFAKSRDELNRLDNEVSRQMATAFYANELIKLQGTREYETERYRRAFDAYGRESIQFQSITSGVWIGQNLILTIGSTAILAVAITRTFSGELNFGDLFLIVSLTQQLFGPLAFVGTIWKEIKTAFIDAKELIPMLVDRNEPSNIWPVAGRTTEASPKTGENLILMQSVGLVVDTTSLLEDIKLQIHKGDRIAILGRSGAGKSSLLRLIAGLYPPTVGRFLILGQEAHDIDQDQYRRRIGIVSQEIVLIDGSIKENIRYGAPNINCDDVTKAARVVGLDVFIEGLPAGYDTLIGTRGLTLSGGQRQRIGIARAIARNPEILVLDECASGLDSISESNLWRELLGLQSERTIIVATHRLSGIQYFNQIHVMANGKIVETGTFHELLAAGGLFSELWRDQRP
jgi:ABC-type bacteriocin/lantibiotic exporter with double-glycine peptidase domain